MRRSLMQHLNAVLNTLLSKHIVDRTAYYVLRSKLYSNLPLRIRNAIRIALNNRIPAVIDLQSAIPDSVLNAARAITAVEPEIEWPIQCPESGVFEPVRIDLVQAGMAFHQIQREFRDLPTEALFIVDANFGENCFDAGKPTLAIRIDDGNLLAIHSATPQIVVVKALDSDETVAVIVRIALQSGINQLRISRNVEDQIQLGSRYRNAWKSMGIEATIIAPDRGQ